MRSLDIALVNHTIMKIIVKEMSVVFPRKNSEDDRPVLDQDLEVLPNVPTGTRDNDNKGELTEKVP